MATLPWARVLWWANILLAVPLTTCVAAFSWHVIEKPALRLRRYLVPKSDRRNMPRALLWVMHGCPRQTETWLSLIKARGGDRVIRDTSARNPRHDLLKIEKLAQTLTSLKRITSAMNCDGVSFRLEGPVPGSSSDIASHGAPGPVERARKAARVWIVLLPLVMAALPSPLFAGSHDSHCGE